MPHIQNKIVQYRKVHESCMQRHLPPKVGHYSMTCPHMSQALFGYYHNHMQNTFMFSNVKHQFSNIPLMFEMWLFSFTIVVNTRVVILLKIAIFSDTYDLK